MTLLRRILLIGVALTATLALAGCAHLVLLHDPLSASERNDLGVAYEASGEHQLAAAEYRKSLRLDPRQSRTWVNLGNAQAAESQWRAAEKSYRRALEESATDTDAMNNLAMVLHHQGRRRDEARSWAERAVAAGGERDSVYRATLNELNRNAP